MNEIKDEQMNGWRSCIPDADSDMCVCRKKPDKKKAAAPKKKKLGVMLLPPRYGLQGVGALAPKKRKGKKK
jgi:hypothetical protein